MTPTGIEPATFRFVAQHLNHCATAVPFQDTNLVTNVDYASLVFSAAMLLLMMAGNQEVRGASRK